MPRTTKRRRQPEPLKVELTVVVNFGDEPEDRVELLKDHEVALIGSIFRYRDRLARLVTATLLKAAMLQPKVASRVLPGLVMKSARKNNS